jgi:sigma-54 specific flagellar transcriptional regulator A
VLLLGESGSGKEVVARFIHAQSERAQGPFAAINCAALSRELLESELFGHEKGAFTGAVRAKPGRLEQAAGGTLFLDEIGELDAAVQAKLLRVLQEREFERVGGTRTLSTDVRIVCATHRDLLQAMREGRFREDLYYRINIVSVKIPPLRERPADINALLSHFLERYGKQNGRTDLRLREDALELLKHYPWPGNVRELANVVERMSVLATDSTLGIDDLPEEIRDQVRASQGRVVRRPQLSAGETEFPSYHDAVLDAKRQILKEALSRSDKVQTRAAKLLGITQPYMARLMKNLEVSKNDV